MDCLACSTDYFVVQKISVKDVWTGGSYKLQYNNLQSVIEFNISLPPGQIQVFILPMYRCFYIINLCYFGCMFSTSRGLC